MIITISGAACTGKSTLLKRIEEYYKNSNTSILFYTEFIRTLFSENYSDKYKDFADLLQGDPEDIIQLHKETARTFNEILWSSYPSQVLVFDRSPLDISIYMYMNLAGHLYDPKVFEKYKIATTYIHNCVSDFLRYDPYIFYARPFTEEIEEDGFRPTSLIERRALELALFDKEFLSMPRTIVLPRDSEARLFKVVSAIGQRDYMIRHEL